jgi:hypothetical protein
LLIKRKQELIVTKNDINRLERSFFLFKNRYDKGFQQPAVIQVADSRKMKLNRGYLFIHVISENRKDD